MSGTAQRRGCSRCLGRAELVNKIASAQYAAIYAKHAKHAEHATTADVWVSVSYAASLFSPNKKPALHPIPLNDDAAVAAAVATVQELSLLSAGLDVLVLPIHPKSAATHRSLTIFQHGLQGIADKGVYDNPASLCL
jgi:hypothetical protein